MSAMSASPDRQLPFEESALWSFRAFPSCITIPPAFAGMTKGEDRSKTDRSPPSSSRPLLRHPRESGNPEPHPQTFPTSAKSALTWAMTRSRKRSPHPAAAGPPGSRCRHSSPCRCARGADAAPARKVTPDELPVLAHEGAIRVRMARRRFAVVTRQPSNTALLRLLAAYDRVLRAVPAEWWP